MEAQANLDRGSELLILILAGALVGLDFAAPMVLGLLYVDLVLLLRYNLRVVWGASTCTCASRP